LQKSIHVRLRNDVTFEPFGALEAGKFADFIVIDRDVLAVPPEQLKDVRVLKTFIAGEIVYERN
jgi:predicted amidohydrolase YtcJ